MHGQLLASFFPGVGRLLKENLDGHFWSKLELFAQKDVRMLDLDVEPFE